MTDIGPFPFYSLDAQEAAVNGISGPAFITREHKILQLTRFPEGRPVDSDAETVRED